MIDERAGMEQSLIPEPLRFSSLSKAEQIRYLQLKIPLRFRQQTSTLSLPSNVLLSIGAIVSGPVPPTTYSTASVKKNSGDRVPPGFGAAGGLTGIRLTHMGSKCPSAWDTVASQGNRNKT
jgi:hypothetical protein